MQSVQKFSAIVGLIMILLFAYLNVQTEGRSPVYKPIRDTANFTVQDLAWAENNLGELNYKDEIVLEYRITNLDDESMERFLDFTQDARDFFAPYGASVISVDNLYNFNAQEGIAMFADYIDGDFAARELPVWYQDVQLSQSAHKNLFDEYDDGSVLFNVHLLPSQNMSEMDFHFLTWEFLGGSKMQWWQKYFLPESVPIQEDYVDINHTIQLAGWLEARPEITRKSYGEVLIPMTLAITAISLSIIYFFVLHSFVQTLIIGSNILLAMFFTRGAIALLGFWESVFTILVYIVCIVPNFSFGLRLFEGYNHTDRSLTREERWALALKDFTTVKGMYFVFFVSVAEFLICLSLQNIFGVEALWQVGILATFGISVSLFLSLKFLVIFHKALPQNFGEAPREKPNMLLRKLSRKTKQFVEWRSSGTVAISFIGSVVVCAVVLVVAGAVQTVSRPQDMTIDTPIEEVMLQAEKSPYGLGNYSLNIVIVPKGDVRLQSFGESNVLNDCVFTEEVRQYVGDIGENAKSVGGPFHFVMDIYHNEGYVDGSLQEVCSATGNPWEQIRQSFFYDHGEDEARKMSQHYLSMDDNVFPLFASFQVADAAEMCDANAMVRSFAQKYTAFDVRLLNQSASYCHTDRMVADGALSNALLSPMVLFFGGLLIFGSFMKKGLSRGAVYALGLSMPFILVTCSSVIVMALFDIPLDVATSASGNMTVSIAVDLPLFLIVGYIMFGMSQKMVFEFEKFYADFFSNTPPFLALVILPSFMIVENLGILLVTSIVTSMIGSIMIMAILHHYGRR